MGALETSLIHFTQVAFWAGLKKGNEFPVPGGHLKRRFIEIIKVKIWACQQAENDF